MSAVALYPLSGDPIHFGHINTGERAAKLFDRVIIAIGINSGKKPLFSLGERVEMARRAFSHIPNIEITAYDELTVDFCSNRGAHAIVRGSRNEKDFGYEQRMFHTHRDLASTDIDVVVFPADQAMTHISSSMVKEIAKFHGDLLPYVTLPVKQALEVKLHNQYILGVTGEPGVGKNYVCEKIAQIARESFCLNAYHIDADQITKVVYCAPENIYREARRKLAQIYGKEIFKSADNDSINRPVLASKVLGNPKECARLTEIMTPPTLHYMRKLLRTKTGLILFNTALIAEAGISRVVNNNVLLVSCKRSTQIERLKKRELEPALSSTMPDQYLNSQYSASKKIAVLQEATEKDGYGVTWALDNTGDQASAIYPMVETIVRNAGLESGYDRH